MFRVRLGVGVGVRAGVGKGLGLPVTLEKVSPGATGGGGEGGGGEGGGGDGGGGEGAGSVTTTVTPCAIETSGLVSTDAPSIEDKLASDSLVCASAFATRADVFAEVLTISSCNITLAAITCSVVWHSGV